MVELIKHAFMAYLHEANLQQGLHTKYLVPFCGSVLVKSLIVWVWGTNIVMIPYLATANKASDGQDHYQVGGRCFGCLSFKSNVQIRWTRSGLCLSTRISTVLAINMSGYTALPLLEMKEGGVKFGMRLKTPPFAKWKMSEKKKRQKTQWTSCREWWKAAENLINEKEMLEKPFMWRNVLRMTSWIQLIIIHQFWNSFHNPHRRHYKHHTITTTTPTLPPHHENFRHHCPTSTPPPLPSLVDHSHHYNQCYYHTVRTRHIL